MRGLKFQFSSALLMILTVAAIIAAAINFQQQNRFRLPDDGVTWVDRAEGAQALYIAPGSQAEKAGLKTGDVLLRINGAQIDQSTDITKVLVRLGAWKRATYTIQRDDVEFDVNLIVGETNRQAVFFYQYLVGAAYLAIGLFVFFRRESAAKARHFYVLCLASFILSTFHYTGKLNNFDKIMYFGNVTAGLLAPTIFLHFCLIFPDPRRWFKRRWGAAFLYLPALLFLALYLGMTSGALKTPVSLLEVSWLLDRAWVIFLTSMYMLGAVVLSMSARKAEEPIVRQQLKWLRNGALLGATPFAVFYAVPYALGALPGPYMNLSVLTLILIPLTWAYAILRYRLMDVDIIFQQGYVYTLATVSVLGIFYGLIFSFGSFEDLGPTSAAVFILIGAFVFQPIRNWIQEVLDRQFFYKDRYDYRRTLVEFARELSSETNLDSILGSVFERLSHTLSVERLAFFLADAEEGGFYLRKAVGIEDRNGHPIGPGHRLDLSFLNAGSTKPYLFFERTRNSLDIGFKQVPATVRQTISDLDLTYYLPCQVRGRTIAYLGVGRTLEGDFLTGEDVELLTMLTGYLGIAVENTRLYASLQRKAHEYERLKEYSENIVESINVGVLAVDMDDRVEEWNAGMERLLGLNRQEALGQRLEELFPADLAERFEGVRGEAAIEHIYNYQLRMRQPAKVIELSTAGGNSNSVGATRAVLDAGDHEAGREPRESIVNVAITPLISKDQQQIGRVIIFDDVTDRSELERRLVQADKLSSIGLLAAGVAHEVNTPLAVISTYAQMLARQVSGDEQKTRLLDKIARQTFRASEIVNSLLNFSRTSTTAFDELDLNRVVRDTLALIEPQMEKAGIKIQLDLEEQLPVVKGNAGKLQQVFLNLFLNARDAMETGGILELTSRRQGQSIRVDVTDSGHGIPPEHIHRIFDPFFTTKAGKKGTGLGLSVTYGIVREHGGDIKAESQPGGGTRFRLEFPLARKVVHA